MVHWHYFIETEQINRFLEVIGFREYTTCLRNENGTYRCNGNGVCTFLIRPVKPHNT